MAAPFAKSMMSFVTSLSPRSLLLIGAADSTFYDASQMKGMYVCLFPSISELLTTQHLPPSLRKWVTPFPPSMYVICPVDENSCLTKKCMAVACSPSMSWMPSNRMCPTLLLYSLSFLFIVGVLCHGGTEFRGCLDAVQANRCRFPLPAK